MENLLLAFLLLGGAPDGASIDSPRVQAHVQAVASARIVRAEIVEFGKPFSRLGGETAQDDRNIFQIATIRSTGEIKSVDGRKIQLQEFH